MDLNPYVDSSNIDRLKASADIIEEVSDLEIYFGICKPGTLGTDENKWSILKIVISGTAQPITTQFLWADGMAFFSHKWDDRATYTYTYKKF